MSSHSKTDEKRRELARQVRQWSVEAFRDTLEAEGVERAYVLSENGEFTLSHPRLLAPLQAFLELSQDFADHEGVFIGREAGIPTLFFTVVHDTRRGLSQGGLRFRPYGSLAEVLVDNIRLAQGMTRKNALAGLRWGGGKGVVPITRELDNPTYRTEGTPERLELFRAYARFVASLGGIYYTAEDVGTKTTDMNALLTQNRFTTCVSPELGGSGNPSPATARGVLRGMQAAWHFLHGTDDLAGVRVAVQGVGHVGEVLAEDLDELGARVWISDIDRDALEKLRARCPRFTIVDEPDAIYDLEVDVLAPCAIGAVVNQHTIPRLKVQLVCGAANNILAEPVDDGARLEARGVTFVPDYLCNRMGITNCCDESFGYLSEDTALAAERVYPDTLRVLRHARRLTITPSAAADHLADLAASELHPLIGHRGRRLVDHLVASDWAGVRRGRRSGADEPAPTAPAPAFDPGRDEPAIRVRWEREGRFRGDGPAIAAAPISAAGRPDLSAFLSAVLMDVRARSAELLGAQRPRRVIGSDPGGLALQLAVERSLSYEHQELGRARFTELCQDVHRQHDEAIRRQLHQLGVGFDPSAWIEPMSPAGSAVVKRLYLALKDAGMLVRERRQSYFDPAQQTELIAPGEAAVEHVKGRRTAELEDLGVPEHLFVDFGGAARHLGSALETGAVHLSDERFADRVRQAIADPEPWAVSRHQWWGHPLPDAAGRGAEEVLSVWFGLVAWTLQALGWPREAAPEPLAEVWVDPDLLMRWVVPSQLIALRLTGRPAFARVEVHGALHVPVRVLEPRAEASGDDLDEERFVVRNKRVLMRRRPASTVEPATLIRRFGADALRLGYLLTLNPGTPEVATLAESKLREARRAVQRLNAKVTGLLRLATGGDASGGESAPDSGIDAEILRQLDTRVDDARQAYAERRFYDAGRFFVAAVDDVARWAGEAAKRRDAAGLRATAETVTSAVRRLSDGFSPVCPYLFDKLVPWSEARTAASTATGEEVIATAR